MNATSTSNPLAALAAEERPVPFAPKARLNPLRVALAIVLAPVVLLPTAEAFAWVVGLFAANAFMPPHYESMQTIEMHAGELYRPRPGDYPDKWGGARINSMGWRGKEIAPKNPGGFRILAIGDSTVFGLYFPESESWPAKLEARLKGEGRDAEVVSMGRVAASSDASRFDLETYGAQLDPDAIVVSVGWFNDYQRFHENPDWTDRTAITARAFEEDYRTAHSPLMWSRLYRIWIGRQRAAIDTRNAEASDEWLRSGVYTAEKSSAGRRVPLEEFRENLSAMCAWANERNISIFFTTPFLNPTHLSPFPMPYGPPVESDRPANFPEGETFRPIAEAAMPIVGNYADAVREVAGSCGATLIDTRAEFLSAKELHTAEEKIWIDYVHFFPKGNRMLADAIHDAIAPELPNR